jgi:hypothetical protein
MRCPSSNLRRAALAVGAAVSLLAACGTTAPRGYGEGMNALVQDGMRVGDAMLALQTRGFACGSGQGVDRRIDCARNEATLTSVCIERLSFVALSNADAVAQLAIAEPACSRTVPDAARSLPRQGDHIAESRIGIVL